MAKEKEVKWNTEMMEGDAYEKVNSTKIDVERNDVWYSETVTTLIASTRYLEMTRKKARELWAKFFIHDNIKRCKINDSVVSQIET